MSQGGVLQMLAVGQQDIYLTTNPQISFFRTVYRRHSPFALESLSQTINGTADWGRRVVATMSRNGDLLASGYLNVQLPALTAASGSTIAWCRHLGEALIKEMSVDIGGAIIDTWTSHMVHIWADLTIPEDKRKGYAQLIGDIEELTTQDTAIPAAELNLPLPFFFCQSWGQALPIVSLMFHEVRINFQFAAFNDLVITGNGVPIANPPSIVNVELFMTYVYLDGVERKVFSQSSHEYLVQLFQYTGAESVSTPNPKLKLTFAHPAKEIIYAVRPNANVDNYANRHFDYTDSGSSTNYYSGVDPVITAKILLNTTERISERSAAFFSVLQPFWHHTHVPQRGVGVYSFALNPEALQPSGSCNFSRLENVSLNFTLSTGTAPVTIIVFARIINVLRVVSGLAGLAYASFNDLGTSSEKRFLDLSAFDNALAAY